MNPYDPCVANKMIEGKQHTIMWHVDDLMASHVNPKVNDNFIKWVRSKYENKDIGEVKVTYGKLHHYLGMNFDFSDDNKLKINMTDYITKMINKFDYKDELKTKATTPATNYIFKVNNQCNKLSKEKSEIFHTYVAKGLFLCKRARPDIQPISSVLCTRVKNSGSQDWNKLMRMVKLLI